MRREVKRHEHKIEKKNSLQVNMCILYVTSTLSPMTVNTNIHSNKTLTHLWETIKELSYWCRVCSGVSGFSVWP